MSGFARVAILVVMAFRDLGAHRVKSLIVGALLAFGTFLVVTGGALLESVSGTMQKSITSSLSGHIQVYSADAEDELQLFGGGLELNPDIGEIEEFGPLRDALLDVDNVAAVVPMGITIGQVFGDSELDVVIEALRDAVDRGDDDARDTEIEHLRMIAADLEKDADKHKELTDEVERVDQEIASLQRVQDDAFWTDFRADPAAGLEFLDNKVAGLSYEGAFYFMRCIGTDIPTFASAFDRFKVVQGQPVPEGRRGILLSSRYYDTALKNHVARELDNIRETMADDHVTLADDATLANRVEANAEQYQRVLFQISPAEGRALAEDLRGLLGRDDGDLASLLQDFLRMDDSNFEARYAWFYDHIAPLIRLYEFNVGDTITLYGQTRTGYQRAVNVKLWGIYQFEGLERSDLAGAGQLIDLVTFRALYGRMTASQQAELDDIRQSVGIRDVSRDDAEAALFGGPPSDDSAPDHAGPADPPPPSAGDTAGAFSAFAEGGDIDLQAQAGKLDDRVYSREEMVDGLVLNVAVIVDDTARIPKTMADVEAAAEGLGLHLKAVGWQQASGIVGQLIMVLQGVVTVSILIVFIVTLVIINNTMVMTTMDRTGEIGTMRAIGAQRSFVVWLFLLETALLALIAGGGGALAAVGFVGWLHQVGIPAVQDILVVMFAGPRLYPVVSAANLVVGMVSVLVISALSTLYPALLAAGVRPVVAMQAGD